MNPCRRELTLADALSDPIIRMVMDADRVDARELESTLRDIGRTLTRRSTGWHRLGSR